MLIKTILVVSIFIKIADPQIAWGSNNSFKELNTRLFTAVFDNNFAAVRSSITAGANVEATNEEGLTAAGLAVEKGYFNIAHYILSVIKQKSLVEKNDPSITSGTLNINRPQTSAVMPNNKQNQTPKDKSPKLRVTSGSRTHQTLPKNGPNPFSPNNYDNTNLPIIGEIQKSGVKPVIQNQTINLRIKPRNPDGAPLKTPDISILRKTQRPVAILPISKTPQKEITPRKTNTIKPERTKLAQEVEFEEEDLFDKVWNKINKVF
jgi:hypothetical protein